MVQSLHALGPIISSDIHKFFIFSHLPVVIQAYLTRFILRKTSAGAAMLFVDTLAIGHNKKERFEGRGGKPLLDSNEQEARRHPSPVFRAER